MAGGTPPPATPLPVEPTGTMSDAWKETAPKRLPSLDPYKFSTADFDVTLITPALNYVMQHPPERTTGAKKAGGTQDMSDIDSSPRRAERLRQLGRLRRRDSAGPLHPGHPEDEGELLGDDRPPGGQHAGGAAAVVQEDAGQFRQHAAVLRRHRGDPDPPVPHRAPHRREQRRVRRTLRLRPGLDRHAVRQGAAGAVLEKEPAKGDERVIDGRMLEQIAKDFAATRL